MGISRPRDLEALRDGLARWFAHWRPEAQGLDVAPLRQPATGLSSETVFVDVAWTSDGTAAGAGRLDAVVRLPPEGDGLFPAYDLGAQGRLQAVLAGVGVRAVAPLAVEEDPAWVGSPFLLMPYVPGRVVQADQPYLRVGWLAEADPAGQARLLHGFLDVLAQIHRLDWAASGCDRILADRTAWHDGGGPDDVAPGVRRGWLAGELEHWVAYLDWAGEGAAPAVFEDAAAWCRARLPHDEPAPSLLWGDVQLGNVLVDEHMDVAAVLDFEMASIGPPEVDVGWMLALHRMAVDRCHRDLLGFPDRAGTVAAYEERLGRPLADLRWYEAFAALRSGAILLRAARLLARMGVDDSWLTKANPTVDLLRELTVP